MKLLGLISSIILLSFSLTTHADDFDNEFNGMNATMDEMDAETGSCIPEMRAQTKRATKMLALLKEKKSKIAALEGKVDNLTAKLIKRSNVKARDTSDLSLQIADLQVSNARLKSENGRLTSSVLTLQNAQTNTSGNQTALLLAQRENSKLKSENERLKSELILGGRTSPTIPPTQAKVVAPVPIKGGGVKLLKVADVNASSDRGRKYRAFNVNDGNPATVWQSANNVTSAQSIKLSFDKSEVVSRFYISIPEYKYGFPPKSVTLYFSDGSSQVFPMSTKWGKQRFSFNPIKTSSIEAEIGDMHKRSPHGSYSFLQVSEIELYGY